MEKRNSRKKCSVVEPRKPHSEAERYKHDVEQAHAMRRRANNNSSGRSLVTSSSAVVTSEKDAVGLGLRGLDEADILREEGHERCALELYQSAIEVLIQYLRNPSSHGASSQYDPAAVEARVDVALSDAQRVKEAILKNDRKQNPSEASTESPFKKTCFSKIKEYLASVRNNGIAINSDLSPTSGRQSAPRVQPLNRKQRNIGARNLPQKKVRSPESFQPNISAGKDSLRQVQPAADASTTNQKNAKESDLLTETVLEDMYIPSSDIQSVTWEDIAGLKQAKQALQEAAILPLLRPDLFTGLRKPQNILLYGSPGTGKTLLVKAVAHESQCNLFVCTASAVTSKWHGEGEKLVRALFRVANGSAPAIIFLDEIDALLSTRKSEGEHEASRRFKTEFMVQMDSISPKNSQVLVIACTNCPWDIDGAILRRFPKRIYVPLPDTEARKALLKGLIKRAGKNSLSSDQITDLVKRMEGFSGSDIEAIASEASFGPLRSVGTLDAIRKIKVKDVRPISIEDFRNALEHATRSVSKEQLNRYDEWNQQQAA